jgi:hypothetical protein
MNRSIDERLLRNDEMTTKMKPSGRGKVTRDASHPTNTVPPPDPEEIRRRAHEVFKARGCAPGRELDDWLTAERELILKRKTSRT